LGDRLLSGTRGSLGKCQLPIADCRLEFFPAVNEKLAIGNLQLENLQSPSYGDR
jgi:hypothetical protein